MNFEIIVSALILQDHEDYLLLCKNPNGHQFHLPNILVKFGQSAEQTLRDYLKNRLGLAFQKLSFISTLEDICYESDHITHRYHLVFKVISPNKESLEPQYGLMYEWHHLPLDSHLRLQPPFLRQDLKHWLEGDEISYCTKDKAYYGSLIKARK